MDRESAPSNSPILKPVLITLSVAVLTIVGFASCYYVFLPWYFGGLGDDFDGEYDDRPSEYEWHTPPQWTTDGSQIIFAQGGSIYAVRADGTSLRLIHGEDGENDLHYSPELSPDGSRMTYLKYRHEESSRGTYHWEVAVSALDGSLERIITDGVGHIGSPSSSPDGQRIAFLSVDDIHTVATDGSDLPSITSARGEIPVLANVGVWSPDMHLSWSRDGRRIGFVGSFHEDGVGRRPANYTLALDGSDLKKIREAGSTPSWSPNGNRVAFSEAAWDDDDRVSYAARLYTADRDGSDPREVVSLPKGVLWDRLVAWSPSGIELLFGPFVASEDGSALIILPPPDVGGTKSSDPSLHSYSLTSWSPDGSRIAVQSDHQSVLYTVARDGSDSRVLVERDDQGSLSAAGGRPLSEGQTVRIIQPDGQ